MEATFKIASKELTEELLLTIKRLFEGKPVVITITTETDETDYLTSNFANKKHLFESIASEPIVAFTPEEFSKHADDLLRQK